jgi:hypothetical protein
VRRLRVRSRLANPRLARQRVEAALTDGASGTGLGKEAILCVRRIAIPLPRLGDMRNVLNAAVAEAARPARDFVPANANAVLFADRAELLACLARDWCTGQATNRWWWPALFPRDDIATIVRRAWLEDVRPVPAAIARLESAGLGARFLTKLSTADVAILWRNIVNTFHLQAHDVAWSAIGPAAVRQSRDTALWSPWVEPHSSLPPEAVRVLITAILLERAPAVVRSASFVREMNAWRIATKTAFAEHPREPATLRFSPNEMFQHAEQGSRFAELSPGQPDLRFGPATTLPNIQEGSPAKRSKVGHPARSDSDTIPQSARAARNSRGRSTASSQGYRASSDIHEKGARADSEKSAMIVCPDAALAGLGVVPLPPAAELDLIHTEWGGSFYLINVAIALRFYGDFTMPARQGLAVPLWDFLALVGERMIGEAFAEDPLPALFVRLSGRAENEPPGADFEPPTGEPMAIWLERICHEVQKRVAASLGLEDDCDLRRLLLNHHAKIETTSARVDAHFSLAKHPIELRIAGVDRDPGWVPAGGRSIYFHYE